MKKERAVAILHDQTGRVLLIHRWNHGRSYFTLPGGKIEHGETPEQACRREAREETGFEVTLGEEVLVIENLGRVEHYFRVTAYSGTLELGEPERSYQSEANRYELTWVALTDLPQINLLPVVIKEWILKNE